MAQILVRDVDDETKRKLQKRAQRHGHSMEAEIRDILRDAVKIVPSSTKGLGSEIAKLFESSGLGSQETIAEIKGSDMKSPFEP